MIPYTLISPTRWSPSPYNYRMIQRKSPRRDAALGDNSLIESLCVISPHRISESVSYILCNLLVGSERLA